MADLPGGKGLKVQVLFTFKTSISLSMAAFHSGNWTACKRDKFWWSGRNSHDKGVKSKSKVWVTQVIWKSIRHTRTWFGISKLTRVIRQVGRRFVRPSRSSKRNKGSVITWNRIRRLGSKRGICNNNRINRNRIYRKWFCINMVWWRIRDIMNRIRWRKEEVDETRSEWILEIEAGGKTKLSKIEVGDGGHSA